MIKEKMDHANSVLFRALIKVQDFLSDEIHLELILYDSLKTVFVLSQGNKNNMQVVKRKILNFKNRPVKVDRIINHAKKNFPEIFIVREGYKVSVIADDILVDKIKDQFYFDFSENRIEQLEESFSENPRMLERFLRTKNSDFRVGHMLLDPFILIINGEENFLVGAESNLHWSEGWHLFTKSEVLALLSNPVLWVTIGTEFSDKIVFRFSQNETSAGLAYLEEPLGDERVRHYFFMEWDLATNYLKLFDTHFINLFSNPHLRRICSMIAELHSNGFHQVELDSSGTKVGINLPTSNLSSVVSLTFKDFERWQLNASQVKVHDKDGNLVGFVKPVSSRAKDSRYWGKWLVRTFFDDGSYFDDFSENAVYGVFQIVAGSNFVLKYRWHTVDSKPLWWTSYRLGEDEPEFFARFHYHNQRNKKIVKEAANE